MKNLNSYNSFLFEKKVDLLIFELSNVNENALTDIITKFTISSEDDAKKLLEIVSDKIKSLDKTLRKKILKYVLALCIGYFSFNTIQAFFPDTEVKQELVEIHKAKEISPLDMHISHEGKEHIKSHEKLKLTAYALGDGKITVGYGHAEDIHKSKLHKGSKISEKTANKLFKKDLKNAEDGVKRMFRDWKKEGINITVTQDQFDVLVSLAFNMGVTGLRQSDFIKELKKGHLEKAGKLIKKTGINPDFEEGLNARREIESDTFLRNWS